MLKPSLFAAALLTAMLGLAGCTEMIASNQDAYVEYPQVHVDSYYLKTWTRVMPPNMQRVGNGQVSVDVPIRNLTDSDINLDYQYSFTDRGTQIDMPSSWHMITVPRKGAAHIQFSSLTTVPDTEHGGNFELIIRERK